jgi:diguanylate cyclase (GGDEF)-like protein
MTGSPDGTTTSATRDPGASANGDGGSDDGDADGHDGLDEGPYGIRAQPVRQDAPAPVPPDVATRLVRAFDRSPSTITTLVDADLTTRWISHSTTWVTRTDPTSRSGRGSFERVHPDDVDLLIDGLTQLRAATPIDTPTVPVAQPLRYRLRDADGGWYMVETLVLNLLDDPEVAGLVLVGRRVDGGLDGVGHVVDLLVQDAPLPDVLAACAHVIPSEVGAVAVVALIDGCQVVGVPSGSPAETLAADDRWWRDALVDGRVRTPDDFAGFPPALADQARTQGFRSAWVRPLLDASTSEVIGCVMLWFRFEAKPNLAIDSGLRQTERLATLVIGEQRRHHALRQAALTDPLTGVSNRLALDRRLHAGEGPVTVAMVDLDDFKPVNDTYGHHTGDAVLRTVADRLVASVRERDLVVRLGGDEFVVVFAPGTPPQGAAQSAQRIIDAIEAPIGRGGGPVISVGASAGLATGPPDDVMRRADDALYEAKRAKRLRPPGLPT